MYSLILLYLCLFTNEHIKTITIIDEDNMNVLSELNVNNSYSIVMKGIDIDEDVMKYLHLAQNYKLIKSLIFKNVEIDNDVSKEFFDFSKFDQLEELTFLTSKYNRYRNEQIILPNSLKALTLVKNMFKGSLYTTLKNNLLPELEQFSLNITSKESVSIKEFMFLKNIRLLEIGIKNNKNRTFLELPIDSISRLEVLRIYKSGMDLSEGSNRNAKNIAFSSEVKNEYAHRFIDWSAPYFEKLKRVELVGKSADSDEDEQMLHILKNKKFQGLEYFLPLSFSEDENLDKYYSASLQSKEINKSFESLSDFNRFLKFKENVAHIEKLSFSGSEINHFDIQGVIESKQFPNLKTLILNLDEVTQGEFKNLVEKYPNISFSLITQIKNDFDGFHYPILKYKD